MKLLCPNEDPFVVFILRCGEAPLRPAWAARQRDSFSFAAQYSLESVRQTISRLISC